MLLDLSNKTRKAFEEINNIPSVKAVSTLNKLLLDVNAKAVGMGDGISSALVKATSATTTYTKKAGEMATV